MEKSWKLIGTCGNLRDAVISRPIRRHFSDHFRQLLNLPPFPFRDDSRSPLFAVLSQARRKEKERERTLPLRPERAGFQFRVFRTEFLFLLARSHASLTAASFFFVWKVSAEKYCLLFSGFGPASSADGKALAGPNPRCPRCWLPRGASLSRCAPNFASLRPVSVSCVCCLERPRRRQRERRPVWPGRSRSTRSRCVALELRCRKNALQQVSLFFSHLRT